MDIDLLLETHSRSAKDLNIGGAPQSKEREYARTFLKYAKARNESTSRPVISTLKRKYR